MKTASPLLFLMALFLCLGAQTLRADWLPHSVNSTGEIKPVGSVAIRVKSSDTEITWAYPACAFRTSYVLVNDSGKAVGLDIEVPASTAFFLKAEGNSTKAEPLPLDTPRVFAGKQPLPATAGFDNKKHSVWRVHVVLPTGESELSVTGTVATALVFTPCTRLLIATSGPVGKWKGRVERESVSLRFPPGLNAADFCDTQQAPCVKDGNVLRWEFRDVDPRKGPSCVRVTFVLPELMEEIARLRRIQADKPGDETATLRLAELLLNASLPLHAQEVCPPFAITRDSFNNVLCALPEETDRTLLSSAYAELKHSPVWKLTEAAQNDPETLRALSRILTKAGALASSPIGRMGDEGYALLQDVLHRNPDNADAQALNLEYFMEYHFIAPDALQNETTAAPLRHAVQEAFSRFPDNPDIAAWNRFVHSGMDLEAYTLLFRTEKAAKKPIFPLPEITTCH